MWQQSMSRYGNSTDVKEKVKIVEELKLLGTCTCVLERMPVVLLYAVVLLLTIGTS